MIIVGTEILTTFIHIVSESLLTPVVVLLVLFLIISILAIGGLVNEKFTRKPMRKRELESLLNDINNSTSPDEIKSHVESSTLFKDQKDIISNIVDNHNLEPEARKSYASKLVEDEQMALLKKTNLTDILVRVGPVLGLLGTLIPLGPGLSALGSGQIATLAEALTIAFDTTVVGLTISSLCYVVSKYKKQWYETDLTTTETVAESVLEKLGEY
ncbi:MAG: MotA/TolQ/ExbB proton channel family protein [Methanobacteriaceae archaeon]|jgi:biopolymer transport protein ExbB/TolQ|nr:MotA/TolQ/ExbB proton channel family protein [Methanobacteriaceae archaeon]